jgi:NADPH-dependent glutamate synthase beta subunit-like oxidoreductase
VSGLDFLRDAAFDRAKGVKRARVAVIGGGNTAVDAARTALRLGAKEVTIVYRRSKAEMPAYPEEREAAEKEGLTILPFAAPILIHGDGKRVARAECLKTQPVEDPKGGRPLPKLVEGTNFCVDATMVIVAAGETPALQFLPATVEMEGSVIRTDYLGRTSMAGVYAGGDAATLSRSVAEAIGSGKRAAIGIDLFLKGNDDRSLLGAAAAAPGSLSMQRYLAGEQNNEDAPIASFGDLNPAYFIESPRKERPELPASDRVRTFEEVRMSLSNNDAILEAARCFQCGRCNLCENCWIFCSDVAISLESVSHAPVVTGTLCEGCGVCIHECPRGALSWERKEHG